MNQQNFPFKNSYDDSKTEIEQGIVLQSLYALGQTKDIWVLVPIIKTVKPWTMLAGNFFFKLFFSKNFFCQSFSSFQFN